MHDPLDFAAGDSNPGPALRGLVARLKESRRLLDQLGQPLAAAYVDMAVHVLNGEAGPVRNPDRQV